MNAYSKYKANYLNEFQGTIISEVWTAVKNKPAGLISENARPNPQLIRSNITYLLTWTYYLIIRGFTASGDTNESRALKNAFQSLIIVAKAFPRLCYFAIIRADANCH